MMSIMMDSPMYPEVRKFNFNPKIFYDLNDKTSLSLGGTFTNENRIGGKIEVIDGKTVENEDDYFERNKSKTNQHSIQFNAHAE